MLVTSIDRKRYKTVVVLPSEGFLNEKLLKNGIETHILPVAVFSRSLVKPKDLLIFIKNVVYSIYIFDKIFKNRKIDIVHSNTLAVFSGAIWAKIRKIPHIWHVHEIIIKPKLVMQIYVILLDLLADKIIAISNAVKNNIVNFRPVLEKKIEIIWNSIEDKGKATNKEIKELKRYLGLNNSTILVTLIGRINRWKGQHLFVNAAEYLEKYGYKNIKFLIVGGTPLGQKHFKESLLKKIINSSAMKKICILDYIENISVVLGATDICVIPSTEPEPFGIVALEAMSEKKPVIAAKHGGLPEIIKNEITGLLFTPNSAKELSIAIARLIENRVLSSKMGSSGYKRFKTFFAKNIFISNFEKTYSDLIK